MKIKSLLVFVAAALFSSNCLFAQEQGERQIKESGKLTIDTVQTTQLGEDVFKVEAIVAHPDAREELDKAAFERFGSHFHFVAK